MNPTSNNFLKSLRENWFLIIFLGSIVMGWATLKNRVDNVQAAQGDQKTDIRQLQMDTTQLQGAVIESKANYIFIKESLSELKTKLK